MQPHYHIIVNKNDITQAVANSLISLSLIDEQGFKNDMLTLNLHDDQTFALPEKGAELSCSLGYLGSDLYHRGYFEVDDVSYQGSPDQITIAAKGSDINSALKTQHSHTYENLTLAQLLATIAARHGMEAKISKGLKSIKIEQLNQHAESDQNLLNRLAKKYGALYKASSGKLLFYQKDDFTAISDKPLTKIIVDKTDCIDFSLSQSDRSKFDLVIARWRDVKEAKTKQIRIGKAGVTHIISEIFANENEAKAHANSQYNELIRSTFIGNLTLVGNPQIASEHEIELIGFRNQFNTAYKCIRSTHTIDDNGYTTQIEIVNKT